MNSPSGSTKRSYIATFDAIRACAVLMVFTTHSGILLHLPDRIAGIAQFVRWSHFGVNLFFVLSGFLITRILIRDKGKPRAYRNFLVRRALRIFPIYYLTIIVLMIIEPGRYLLWSASYTSNYAYAIDTTINPMLHSWSLSVEEHYYLLWSPIVLFLSLKISRGFAFVIFPLISILGAAATFAYFPEHAQMVVYQGTHVQIFALALGSAMAFGEDWLRTSSSRLFRVGITLVISGIALNMLLGSVFEAEVVIRRFYSYSLVSTGILCVFLGINDIKVIKECEDKSTLLSNAKGVLYRLCTLPILVYIGRISYGLYLYHFPIYTYFDLFPPKQSSALGTIALSIALTFVMAIVSFHLIEQPILRKKARFA
ncbi:MAG: acyltransferase [Phycisphaerales bacterium]|nr:acyltransferase [Phycisphaerales bacterium]